MLLGDFNSHKRLWGCSHNSSRANIIEDLIGRHDLCYFNDKSPTYIHAATQTPVCNRRKFQPPFTRSRLQSGMWERTYAVVTTTPYSSTIHLLIQELRSHAAELHRADWETFKALVLGKNSLRRPDDCNRKRFQASSPKLIKIAELCIPKSSTKPKRPYFPCASTQDLCLNGSN